MQSGFSGPFYLRDSAMMKLWQCNCRVDKGPLVFYWQHLNKWFLVKGDTSFLLYQSANVCLYHGNILKYFLCFEACLSPPGWGISYSCHQQRLVGNSLPLANAQERSHSAGPVLLAGAGASFTDVYYWWWYAEFVLGTGWFLHISVVWSFAMRFPLCGNFWVGLHAKWSDACAASSFI